MANSTSKPRSTTTTSIFEAFVQSVREDYTLGDDIADRLKHHFETSQPIKVPVLHDAIFPPDGDL